MLVAGLLDGGPVRLDEVVRTRVSVHYETPDPSVPVLTVCTPEAVRLPASLVTTVLPPAGPATVDRGLSVGGRSWRVLRWWRPARPVGLPRPSVDVTTLVPPRQAQSVRGVPVPGPAYDGLSPVDLVGRGPGLTPAGDDVLAGALVAAHATADPRLPRWRQATRHAVATRGTTAVSRALLHHAIEGYATPELASVVAGLCGGRVVAAETAALLRVGHTSGAALLAGALHTLSTCRLEGAA